MFPIKMQATQKYMANNDVDFYKINKSIIYEDYTVIAMQFNIHCEMFVSLSSNIQMFHIKLLVNECVHTVFSP